MVAVVTKEIIMADMKKAMKDGERCRVSTLRLLLADIKNREIELGSSLDTKEYLALIASAIKKRREAIESFEKAGREDRAETERQEMAILQSYQPPPLGEDELNRLIEEAVTETGASSIKDIGRVMKSVMVKVEGRAEGREINRLVIERLS